VPEGAHAIFAESRSRQSPGASAKASRPPAASISKYHPLRERLHADAQPFYPDIYGIHTRQPRIFEGLVGVANRAIILWVCAILDEGGLWHNSRGIVRKEAGGLI
jgi:hypothetical protein